MTRGLIEAVVMTEAGPLRLMNTHLEYSHPEIRAAQVETIRRVHEEACARTVTPRNDSWGTYKFTPSTPSLTNCSIFVANSRIAPTGSPSDR